MENESISLIVETDKDGTFVIEAPSPIKSMELRELLRQKITKSHHFYFIYKNKNYKKDDDINEVLKINEGEKIYIVNTFSKECHVECNFHKNINLNEADMKVEELSGILHLCNLKNIARYIDLSRIKDNSIKEIMKDLKQGIQLTDNPQEDIKESLSNKDGNN